MTLIHNGYDIQFLNDEKEVEGYIQGVISKHLNLSPKKIMDRTLSSKDKKVRLIRYKYSTLYEEDFIIEYN